ncbi:PITPNA [Branchiostoma lanceolatum]|uniref:PITPNA protein n=1 Tax=Branchiostoma lanceolatum TaxID=7740 RepID=A0A8J9VUH6_BRALA|nr:PITPNA [Branchiostoma lanceolatum]
MILSNSSINPPFTVMQPCPGSDIRGLRDPHDVIPGVPPHVRLAKMVVIRELDVSLPFRFTPMSARIRVYLPITVPEYQVGQLWSVAEASKNETGGGEGVEVLVNEPFENEEMGKGQYTHKIYHLKSKVPKWISKLAPKGSLEMHEKAWNAYPYCRTIITNPDYMKENFELRIETWHKKELNLDNPHKVAPEVWRNVDKVDIDIGNDPVDRRDYNPKEDPSVYHSFKTGRGPLKGDWIKKLAKETDQAQMCAYKLVTVEFKWWGLQTAVEKFIQKEKEALMCAYKLVTIEFKWWGLQTAVEHFIQKSERRIFTNFHRQLFCWLDEWHGLTMEDIRRLEDETKLELDKQRAEDEIRGHGSLD